MRSLSAASVLLLFAPGILFSQNNTWNNAAGTGDSAGTVYKVPLQLHKSEAGERYKLTADRAPGLFQKNETLSREACPVNLRAQRQGAGAVIYRTGDRPQDPTPAQQLQVTFFNFYARNVVSMVIKVHGLDGAAQVMPADPIRRGAHDVTRTIELNLSVLSRQSASTELTMRKFGTVSQIEVESVEFAYGTSWKAAEEGVCSFTPELYMLVGSR